MSSSAESSATTPWIPVDQVSGLWPRVWIAVGPGFSREEVKGAILDSGQALSAQAVTTLPEIASALLARISGADTRRERMLGAAARQEVLRALLAERRISVHLSELRQLKRQAGFFRKLDLAIQAGRMAVAHADEDEALAERLRQRLGPGQYRPLRDEVRVLSAAFEAWLAGAALWDPPRLLREATTALAVHGWPEALLRPEEIRYFSAESAEALENTFCEELARGVRFTRVSPGQYLPTGREGFQKRSVGSTSPNGRVDDRVFETQLKEGFQKRSVGSTSPNGRVDDRVFETQCCNDPGWEWERWHTLDDAAEGLVDRLATEGMPLSEQVVLIPDQSAVRRSLRRALALRGIPLADARDPNRLRSDETVKWALLPIEVVARDFRREEVLSYLRGWQDQAELPTWRAEIASRGIRQGLSAYAGGHLAGVHSRLSELSSALGGRRASREAADAHLRLLRSGVADRPERAWIVDFLEPLWEQLVRDQGRIARKRERAPVRFWLERLLLAIAEAPAPMEALRAIDGVQVFRAHQASLASYRKVWLFGIAPAWLSVGSGGGGVGDYWFNDREREILAGEFGIRSGIEVRRERLSALSAWLSGAENVVILDSHYDWDGREREGLSPLLREVARELNLPGLNELVDKETVKEAGAHSRFLRSYDAIRPVPPRSVSLPPLARAPGGGPPELTATTLDRYSRCAFQALAFQRWRLKDGREPEAELWPEVRGNILHQAVKHLLASRDEEGRIRLSASQALERAWKERPPKGLLRGRRVENHVRDKLLRALDVFLEKEREFQERARTRTLVLDDDLQFRIDFGDFVVVGTPDRIERTEEGGAFVMDYKTSSGLPNGSEMVETGYRLQLPFYAIATESALKASVVGVQFVELSKKGSRGSGIFFGRWNGKEPGKLTNVRSNSKSLVAGEPEEAWARLREQVIAHGRGWVSGRFDATPKRGKRECDSCTVSDLCGLRRLSGDAGDGAPSGGPET